jgi:REP element-mobilizing transposase RayT
MDGYRIRDESKPHFVTFTVVDWVDVFSRSIYRDKIIESFEFCKNKKGMILYAYVIMSNHIHLIIQSDQSKLSDLIRDLKAYLAREIIKMIESESESRADWILKRFEFAATSNKRNEKRQFWKYGNHPEEIFSEKFFWLKANYIHMNPLRAKIVSRASDYLYSSASNYVGKDSVFDGVTLMSNPIVNPMNSNWMAEINEW